MLVPHCRNGRCRSLWALLALQIKIILTCLLGGIAAMIVGAKFQMPSEASLGTYCYKLFLARIIFMCMYVYMKSFYFKKESYQESIKLRMTDFHYCLLERKDSQNYFVVHAILPL